MKLFGKQVNIVAGENIAEGLAKWRGLAMRNAILAISLTFLILISTIYVDASIFSPTKIVTSATATTYTFTISGAPSSVTAGQSFSGIVVTVYNSNDKVATGFKGSVYFTSTDPKATLPYTAQCEYTYTTGSKGDKGVHTFSGFNLVTAGSQTITVTDVTSSATTSAITVNDASPTQIQIAPKTATVIAGSKQTCTATATDYYGNLWVVTSLTSWSISTGAGGSWSANTYTSSLSGTWAVTGSYSNVVGTASLTVNPSTATSIKISPQSATISAGSTETYTVTASDNYGNSWSVTSSTVWSISSGTGGSWSQNVYTSHKVGVWTVTGTYGALSASASLTVIHGSPSIITLSPQSATIAAGSTQTFTATASDSCGNTWDVTSSTSWGINSGAGGSWSSNVYTSAMVGLWTVTGSYDGLSSTASLTVGYCMTFKITLSPENSVLTAGTSEAFTATASDIYGNVWDVTSSAAWSVQSGAGGSWVGNTYTSETSGTWTVTGTYEGISGTATITVNNGSPVRIVVGATSSSVTAGSTVSFTSIAVDSCDNAWDVSGQTSWSISSGAGGSWSGNVYTTNTAGTWTVTGTYGDLSNTYSLVVTNSSPVSITLSPETTTLTAGSSGTFAATAIDNCGNIWAVSGTTLWGVSSGAGGSWSNNVYTAGKANVWTVTGTFDSLSNTASLTVTHGSATSISVTPTTSTITAGTTQTFTITAFDGFGNSWDATSSATIQVGPQASGSLSANVYTSCNAGTWTVTATSFGLTDTTSLTVIHSSPVSISVGPNSDSITAGQSQTYTATALDAYGNIWDVTSATAWNVNNAAGGSWVYNTYTSQFSGSWVVTGTYSGLSDFAYLTVNPASAVNIVINPGTEVMNAGSSEAFTATASDQYGNQWDVSNVASWAVSSGAGGSWNAHAYTSGNTGNWAVTAALGGLYGTASLTVNHGTALSISITPGSTTIIAGQSQTFTVMASDSNGNNWDVTSSTTWSIDSGAGGFWIGNTYTSNNAGTWSVTATYSGASSTASLIVNDGPAVSITVGPTSSSIIAGSSQAFTATASDSYGNTWDVTGSTVWTIDAGAGGSWAGNTYNSQLSGVWDVTGSFSGLSSSVYLTVNHSAAESIQVNPYGASITAGTSEVYTVTAVDNFGNQWDVTSSATWGINSNAGGSWSGNVYTAAEGGTWTVNAIVANLQSSVPVTVNHGSAASIVVSPQIQTVTSGSSQAFSATAYDSYGNSWDATALTSWSIDANAFGSWTNNIYTSEAAGNWLVTGTLSTLSNSASLTVIHGSLVSITISPPSASINAGSTQAYTATASDANGNTWDITSTVSWIIGASAGGSWAGNVYTSSNTGTWTVTGAFAGTSSTAQLSVSNPNSQYCPADFYHTGTVNFADLVYFVQAYINYGEYGICNPLCDFNHDGCINFQDLVIFVNYYITYGETNPQNGS